MADVAHVTFGLEVGAAECSSREIMPRLPLIAIATDRSARSPPGEWSARVYYLNLFIGIIRLMFDAINSISMHVLDNYKCLVKPGPLQVTQLHDSRLTPTSAALLFNKLCRHHLFVPFWFVASWKGQLYHSPSTITHKYSIIRCRLVPPLNPPLLRLL